MGHNRDFNPRIRVGCDPVTRRIEPPSRPFQSTHPRRMRLADEDQFYKYVEFQSTHPRRMRPIFVRRSTEWVGFQSTHPRRMRHIFNFGSFAGAWNFNPRIRVGCDVMPPHPLCKPSTDFNPRIRVGCDLTICERPSALSRFQSTHPRRMRHETRKTDETRSHISIHASA